MLTAIVGINWGDEGKGRMVDLLSEDQDIVVRYQGGNNAGHTVVNDKGKFILNLLPSGILREDIVNVMGAGMVIDIEHLSREVGRLRQAGIKINSDNLLISDRAIVCFPYDVMQDCLEEDRLGSKQFGSTRRGIAPVYGDKYLKKAVRMGDLQSGEYLRERLSTIVPWKNMTLTALGGKSVTVEEMIDWADKFGSEFKDNICDTGAYLENAAGEGKKIIFEAQLGALRDIDFGIYPYTSSSSTISAYAPIGAGISGRKIERTIGIMKAYSTCVGGGPFTVEMQGGEAEALREAGGEYGAATGRPRRVGGFDVVASKYGIKVQGADEIALTKLDVLSYMDKLPICVSYTVNGRQIMNFPQGKELETAVPNYIYMEGWKQDVSGCRKFEELPAAAQNYISYIEKATECKIKYISVGAEREKIIII